MEMEAVTNILCRAIENRVTVTLVYSGAPRRIAPYAVFASGSGQLLLHGVEVGAGEQGAPIRFRNYDLRHVAHVAETGETFTPDPAFDPAARRFRFGVTAVIEP